LVSSFGLQVHYCSSHFHLAFAFLLYVGIMSGYDSFLHLAVAAKDRR